MGQEEDLVWKTPGGMTLWDIITRQNIPRQIFFFDLVLCVVGRFACQVPNLSATRTAIPERFFGRKITAGNFLRENHRPERGRYRPPSYLLEGTCQAKRAYDGFL